MTDRHGRFIWYELMTRDPQGAKSFYGDVVGWRIAEGEAAEGGYGMIAAGDDYVGGVLTLSEQTYERGARSGWVGYVGVDDVDSSLRKAERLGGKVLMPARDMPDVGRIAMVADPQGAPLYVMHPSVDDRASSAFDATAKGHCAWNELATADQAAALAYYGELFGWRSVDAMPMGNAGDYRFIDHQGVRLGAVSPLPRPAGAPAWNYYFRVADIETAKTRIEARGGRIVNGPHEVPGGDHVVIGTDPEGASFALVGRRDQ